VIHLFDKIRLLPTEREESYSFFSNLLSFEPQDISIYQLAVHHRSVIVAGDKNRVMNNERLEFLGDAVLGSVVADILFHRYPDKKEGFLTNARSKIVQRSTLNRIAEKLHLDEVIKTAPQVKKEGDMLGSVFEALIGAIYLDAGYQQCYDFIQNRILDEIIDMGEIFQKVIDYKSQLIIWAQKNKVEISYDVVQTEQHDGKPVVFHSFITMNGYKATEALGNTKKEAQQLASKYILNDIKRSPIFWDKVKKHQLK
jgi:ribonuclease-3